VAESDDTKSGGKPEEEASSASDATKQSETAVAQPENRRARRAAASTKRRPGIPERPGSRDGLATSEKVDDAFSRAFDRTARWVGDHFNIFQWVIVAGIAGWIGWQIYDWRSDKAAVKTSEALSEAVSAELGRSGGADEGARRDARGSLDARRSFATDEARLAAAKDSYQKVVADVGSKPAGTLAKLGLAGVLFDQGKFDEAIKTYEEVLSSELAKIDPESKGRAIEGIGFALEAKGDKDGAMKRFKELEIAEIAGFRELALYHQARIAHAQGDKAGAVDRLKKIIEKLGKETKGTEEPDYLLEKARALLQRVDPSAVPPPSQDEALRNALEAFQKKLPAGVNRMPAMPPPSGP
jgi:predicted negative regulator of RcsB-dependent stress response